GAALISLGVATSAWAAAFSGPTYSLPGGGSCSGPTGGAEKLAGGGTWNCTSINTGGTTNRYFGIRNDTVGNIPIGDKMNSNGTTEPSGGEIWSYSSQTANTLVFTGSTTIVVDGVNTTAFTRLTLTFQSGTGSIVDDANTQALTNANGAVRA